MWKIFVLTFWGVAMQSDNLEIVRENAKEASKLLKSMSNRCRLLILCALAEGEMSVGSLEETVKMSQSSISQHLKRLHDDGLVERRRDAQTVFYSLDGERAAIIISALHHIFCGNTDQPEFFSPETVVVSST